MGADAHEGELPRRRELARRAELPGRGELAGRALETSFRFASDAYYDCYNDFRFGPAVDRGGTLRTNYGPY